jgi:hypothetical protein
VRKADILVVLFLVLATCALTPKCCAQDATCFSVRILDQKSGKPIRGVLVSIFPNYWNGADWSTSQVIFTVGRTDQHGTVKYCPTAPAPDTFRLEYYQFAGPDEEEHFRLADVLKTGVVGFIAPNTRRFKGTVIANPREVVVLGRRWDIIDRILPPMDF